MARKYQKKNENQLRVANEHIDALFKEAGAVRDVKLGSRYVELARKIAMKFKIRLASGHKRMFCKHCYKFLVPGKNLRVRVHDGKIIYYCLECKKFWRKRLR